MNRQEVYMASSSDCKDQVTDDLSNGQQGPVLCPICEEGYLVTLKGQNTVLNEAVDCFYERCTNGCGSELGSEKTANENARIARGVRVSQMAREGRKWKASVALNTEEYP